MITLIVARARDGAIGKDGDIPWFAPEDLRMFQRETIGGALIMGRHTWESLPVKPLKSRLNCVISRDETLTDFVFQDVQSPIEASYAEGYTRIYGIGGQAIYAALLPLAHRLLITEVALSVPDADAFFPPFHEEEWFEIRDNKIRTEDPQCTLRELIRRIS